MNRRGFLRGLMALGAGIVVVGPSVLADVHRYLAGPTDLFLFDSLPQQTFEGINTSTFPQWKPYRLASPPFADVSDWLNHYVMENWPRVQKEVLA